MQIFYSNLHQVCLQIKKQIKQKNTVSLPEGVRRLTSLPATRLGLKDRGLVKEGFKADLVVFDPDKVKSNWTIKDPRRYATGYEHVFVGGMETIARGERTKNNNGVVLRGSFS